MKQHIFAACDPGRSGSTDEGMVGESPETASTRVAMPTAGNRAHWLASPFDEDGDSTLFGSTAATLAVLRAASRIEPDPIEAGAWYRYVGIAEFGGFTAEQLVALGRCDEVIGFLLSVNEGSRG